MFTSETPSPKPRREEAVFAAGRSRGFGAGPRVVVADRFAATRSGIRAALEAAGFIVAAECSDAESLVSAAARHAADLCLVDADLPGGGIAAARILAAQPHAPAVVMLVDSESRADLFAALRAGACGAVEKDLDRSRLAALLEPVLRGGAALSPELTARLIDEFRALARRRAYPSSQPLAEQISAREWQVLELLADGLTTKRIALELRIAPATVRRHIASALQKLGLADRRAAVELIRSVQRRERE